MYKTSPDIAESDFDLFRNLQNYSKKFKTFSEF